MALHRFGAAQRAQRSDNTQSDNHTLRHRVALLRWALPAALLILTLVYEVVLVRWLQDNVHDPIDLEIFLYGVLSPLLAFWVLTLIGRWCPVPAAP
jgi:hypothetical protein